MDGDFANNLANWGFATMAAGSQPGARLLGAVGQGGLTAAQMAHSASQLQSENALRGAQTQNMQLQNQMVPLQMKKLQAETNLYSDPSLFGDVTPSPTATSTLSPSATNPGEPTQTRVAPSPMSSDNAAKMQELYPDDSNEGGLSSTQGGVVPLINNPTSIPQRNFGQNINTSTSFPPAPGSMKRAMVVGLLGNPRLAGEMYATENAGVKTANEQAAKLPFAAQEAAAKERGTTLEKNAEKVDSEAQNSVEANYLLDNIKQSAANVPLGKFADYKEHYLAIKNALGVSNPDEDKTLANFQDLDKNALALRTQAVKQISSRPSQMEFIAVGNALPNKKLSEGGFNLITNQMQSLNDFKIAKQTAQSVWRQSHPTLEGFETTFNSQVSPATFLVNRLSPTEFHEMANNLQKTKQGQQTLKNLMLKMKYATDNGFIGQH